MPGTMRRIGRFLVRTLREWGPVIIAVLLIRSFLVESFLVPTGSMLDTIELGDFMLVNKFIYGVKLPFTDRTIVPFTDPQPGDIVVRRGKGIPRVNGRGRGNHHVRFIVKIPERLSSREEELLRQIADESGDEVAEKKGGLFSRLKKGL